MNENKSEGAAEATEVVTTDAAVEADAAEATEASPAHNQD